MIPKSLKIYTKCVVKTGLPLTRLNNTFVLPNYYQVSKTIPIDHFKDSIDEKYTLKTTVILGDNLEEQKCQSSYLKLK